MRSNADATTPLAHRNLVRFIDVDTGLAGSPHIAKSGEERKLAQDITITASSPGLPSTQLVIPVSTDAAVDSVLAAAEASAGKPVTV